MILIAFTGCKKNFFELERPVQKPWQNLSEFDRAAIGAYNKIFSNASGGWGNNFDYIYLVKNATGDDVGWVNKSDADWGWQRDTENNKYFLDNLFGDVYLVIASCNDVFKFVEDNGGNPFPGISEEDKKDNLDRVVGELYFMRAYCYYNLATIFCNAYVPGGANDAKQIPLITELADGYTTATNPKMGTVQEVWDLILADLQKAYQLLPERFIAGRMHPSYEAGRANKFAAAVMLARAYFQMGNYPKAKEYADFVITQNSGDYDLSEDPIEALTKNILGRGKEVIMYIPNYDPAFARLHFHASLFQHRWDAEPNGYAGFPAAYLDSATVQRIGWMNNPAVDYTILPKARRDKRFTQVLALRDPINVPEDQRIPGVYIYNNERFTRRSIFCNKLFRGTTNFTNIPVFRLPEMYLTSSICAFKAGDKTTAAANLNVVRKRAWDAAVAGMAYENSPDFVTAANVTEQMINDERLIV